MYYGENVFKYCNGAFVRRFRWDLEKIIPQDTETEGYIVQYINRETTDNKGLCCLQENEDENSYNHDYWEAWPVKKGIIELSNYGYDDSWELMPSCWKMLCKKQRLVEMLKFFEMRYLSHGKTTMQGQVYWAPKGSNLYGIVNTEFSEKIKWADQLPSARKINIPDDNIFIAKHTFTHGWDLSTEDRFVGAIMCFLTEYTDEEQVIDAIEEGFVDRTIKELLLVNYRKICMDSQRDAEKHLIQRPPKIKKYIENKKLR